MGGQGLHRGALAVSSGHALSSGRLDQLIPVKLLELCQIPLYVCSCYYELVFISWIKSCDFQSDGSHFPTALLSCTPGKGELLMQPVPPYTPLKGKLHLWNDWPVAMANFLTTCKLVVPMLAAHPFRGVSSSPCGGTGVFSP